MPTQICVQLRWWDHKRRWQNKNNMHPTDFTSLLVNAWSASENGLRLIRLCGKIRRLAHWLSTPKLKAGTQSNVGVICVGDHCFFTEKCLWSIRRLVTDTLGIYVPQRSKDFAPQRSENPAGLYAPAVCVATLQDFEVSSGFTQYTNCWPKFWKKPL